MRFANLAFRLLLLFQTKPFARHFHEKQNRDTHAQQTKKHKPSVNNKKSFLMEDFSEVKPEKRVKKLEVIKNQDNHVN